MAERPSRPRIQSASLRDLILELHSRTWGAHDKLVQQWTQYLFFVNSGGAGAVLAFLGTDKAQPDPWQVRSTLIAFVVGIVLVGVSRACRTKSGDIQGQRLIALMVRAKLYDQAPSGAQLKEGLTKTQKEKLLDGVASWSEWSSFACAIVAAVIGGLGLFR